MPGISRAFRDVAVGLILRGKNNVRVNGMPIVCILAPVAGHGDRAHAHPRVLQSSTKVYAGGRPVVRQGDVTSCGHMCTGSTTVHAGG